MVDLISWFLLCTFVVDSGGRIKSHAQAGPVLYSTGVRARDDEPVKSSNKTKVVWSVAARLRAEK